MIDHSAFIAANTAIAAPPACPEVRLHLATEITPLWQATESYLDLNNLPPPYWAFCWAGGQALSRYLLDSPEVVRGKRVLDFASGCGVSAVAAAMAGAACVEANEIDDFAAASIRLNAALNGVAVDILCEDIIDREGCPWDVVAAGDVCYERPMAERVFPWLRRLAAAGAVVLMADPGRNYLPKFGLMKVAEYAVPTSLELEDRTSRDTVVYRIVG